MKKAAALKYNSEEDKAPKVIAKGSGAVAEKILELAKQYGVPIQENDELVSALMKLDIGEVIPEKLYPVVAQILAFIYTLDQRARKI